MEAKFSKRLYAYILDIIILGIVLMIVNIIIPKNNEIKENNVKLDSLTQNYLDKEINFNEYVNDYSEINYELDKQNIVYTVVNIIFVIVYFIIVPYFFKGQTIGKKVFKIKVFKENKLTITSLIIRNLIINGLAYMSLTLILLFILPYNIYFIITSILTLIQLIIMIIIIIGIIKNNKKLILHDKLSKTQVVNV